MSVYREVIMGNAENNEDKRQDEIKFGSRKIKYSPFFPVSRTVVEYKAQG